MRGDGWRRTLANPLLYRRLVARLAKLNGNHFYPCVIDDSLEYGEALADIRRHHKGITTDRGSDEPP